MVPTRLQLGTSRLEQLPENCLRRFLDKSWIHLGDAPDSPTRLKAFIRRIRQAKRGITDPQSLYQKTNFQPFYFEIDGRLPFADGTMHFVFSEHFFEHLFLDEAIALFRECHRVLSKNGVMRISVPDADLRTYEPPESVGYPDIKMPYNHPNKHKTRWSVYSLTEVLKLVGFDPHPLRFCDRAGKYIQREPIQYDGCPEPELVTDLSYLRRPNSLVVDAVKR